MIKLNTRQAEHIEQNADIGATGVLTSVEIPRDRLVSINISASAGASYSIDVSADRGTWFEDEVAYDQDDLDDPTDIRDAFILGDRYLRVRVTDPAGSSETADVTIQVA